MHRPLPARIGAERCGGAPVMDVRIEATATAVLVIAEGRLDFGAAAAFQKHLERALAGAGDAAARVLVDCAGLEYVSSAGLRVFLLGAKTAQRAGVAFALCALRPPVREVVELSGFGRIIAVYPDRAAALAGTRGSPP